MTIGKNVLKDPVSPQTDMERTTTKSEVAEQEQSSAPPQVPLRAKDYWEGFSTETVTNGYFPTSNWLVS
jgi:hypothetical protein